MTDTKQKPRSYANFDRFIDAAPKEAEQFAEFISMYKNAFSPLFWHGGIAFYFYRTSFDNPSGGSFSCRVISVYAPAFSPISYEAEFTIEFGDEGMYHHIPDLAVTMTDRRRIKRLANGDAVLADDSTGQLYTFSGEPIAHPQKPC